MILCVFCNLVTNLQTVNLCIVAHRKQTPIHVADACMFFCRLLLFSAFSTAGYIIMFERFCVMWLTVLLVGLLNNKNYAMLFCFCFCPILPNSFAWIAYLKSINNNTGFSSFFSLSSVPVMGKEKEKLSCHI